MAVRITVPYEKLFLSPLSLEATYQYFSNFEKSIPGNFPGLEVFEPQGNETYRWVFEKVGHSGYELQIQLITRFEKHPHSRINAVSVAAPGASGFKGGWAFQSQGEKTQVTFQAQFEIELPIPSLLKSMAAPLAQRELTKLFDRYIARVEKNIS